MEATAQRRLLCRYAPLPAAGERLLLGLDASDIARPDSPTAADRTYQPMHNLPRGKTVAQPGWQFSTVTALPPVPSAWTYLLESRRIRSDQTALPVGAAHLPQVLALLPVRPVDRAYGVAAFLLAIAPLSLDVLVRLKTNLNLYRPAQGWRPLPP